MKRIFAVLLLALFTAGALAQVPIYTRPAPLSGGGTFLNPLLAPDGACGTTPSYAFASSPSSGVYFNSGGPDVDVCVAGTRVFAVTSGSLFTSNTITIGTGGINTNATVLASDAANTFAVKNGNSAQESRVYAGNGGFISNVKTVTESLTIAAAATTASVTNVPAGAILLAVSVRVTTVIPTAATFTVTTTTGGTALNTAAVSTAATSTDPGTAAGASFRAAATTVTITPNLTPGAATGVVRLQFYYLQVTPPTS